MGRVNCLECAFFYVTWDSFFPRGCRALAFKSREFPSEAVYKSSGIECQAFERKLEKKHGTEP